MITLCKVTIDMAILIEKNGETYPILCGYMVYKKARHYF